MRFEKNKQSATMKKILFVLCLMVHNATAQPAKTAKIASYQGKPAIYVNNQPISPHFYALTHVYGGRWSWEERPSRNLANFCEAGIKLYQVDLYLEDIWYKNTKKLDIKKAQKQVQGVLDVCPNANIVVRIHVNAPFWWNETHREECAAFADGPLDTRRYGPPFNMEDGDVGRPLRASLASQKWRTEAGQQLKTFCAKFAKTKQSKSVIGLHISGGVYGEWHNWGFIDHDPDTSPAMTRYFQQWLTNKYKTDHALQTAWKSTQYKLSTATVPDTTERNFTADGIFRDPKKEQRVIDYFIAQQEVVVEDIEYFCKIAKTNWGRPLIVGVFYGYFHSTFSRQATGGHIMVERILNCPDIDYLAAPQSYWDSSRRMGGSGISRGIVESTLLHGKLWLDELDNGSLQTNRARDFVRSDELLDTNYAQVLRRSTALPLMRGIGLWYYDFGPQRNTGWWDSPLYMNRIKEDIAFFNKQFHQPYRSVADVLYVYDQDNFYYLKGKKTPISIAIPDKGVEEAMHSGVVGDHIYLFDIERVNLANYKAIVFVNCFMMTQKQKQFIHEKVAREGRTIVWNYLPGYTDGIQNDLKNVSDLTGIQLYLLPDDQKRNIVTSCGIYSFDKGLQPAAAIADTLSIQGIGSLADGHRDMVIARKIMPTHTAVMATMPIQGSDLFRSILREAGCHVYNEQNDFVFAHSNMILLHTATAGIRKIFLKNGKVIEITLKRAETILLDSETGAQLLGST